MSNEDDAENSNAGNEYDYGATDNEDECTESAVPMFLTSLVAVFQKCEENTSAEFAEYIHLKFV